MRVVFLRSGWMRQYAGQQHGDDGPIGGGDYNVDNLGHERFNFLPVNGRVYAYFQSPKPSTAGLNFARIDPDEDGQDTMDDVLVAFVATHPKKRGQRVVGWYRSATLHARLQPAFGTARADCGYQVECSADQAVLLPPSARRWLIPTGTGGMSQTHVRYPRDDSGKLAAPKWMSRIVAKIEAYTGQNMLSPLTVEAEEEAADQLEEQLGRHGQGGFQPDARVRAAVEEYAMLVATKYFAAEGWTVVDTSAKHPFDLLITKGKKKCRVEVKGTTGDGSAVVLTRGEVDSARKHASALFILHSITAITKGTKVKTSGGVRMLLMPWDVSLGVLTPVSYFYQPPG